MVLDLLVSKKAVLNKKGVFGKNTKSMFYVGLRISLLLVAVQVAVLTISFGEDCNAA